MVSIVLIPVENFEMDTIITTSTKYGNYCDQRQISQRSIRGRLSQEIGAFWSSLARISNWRLKRRGYTQVLISERTGLSRLTIRKIEKGDPSVSIGHYLAVLSVLGLAEDFARVAADDELGRKLQDIKLMSKKSGTQP
jgi:DNA-binding XRE family transcriptional regulator